MTTGINRLPENETVNNQNIPILKKVLNSPKVTRNGLRLRNISKLPFNQTNQSHHKI